MSRRIVGMVLMAVAASVATACGGTTDGTPTTATPAALWNPCTQIPDQVLRDAGVDPATEESGIGGVHQSGWEICSWNAPEFSLAVFSTGRVVAEFEQKSGNVEFRDITISGRQGRQFKVEGASKHLMCDAVFPAAQGVVQLNILNHPALDDLEDPCAVLSRVGETVVPLFPQ